MTARDVRSRIGRLLPFLTLGPTITPHVRGDSLYWFVEGFITARRYPLSEAVLLDALRPWAAAHSPADLLLVLPALRLASVSLGVIGCSVHEEGGVLRDADDAGSALRWQASTTALVQRRAPCRPLRAAAIRPGPRPLQAMRLRH